MTKTPVFFDADEADIPAIAALSLGTFGEAQLPLTPRQLRHYLNKGHAALFGYKDGAALAGYCLVELNDRQRRAYINEIAVAEAWRGRSLASRMLARAEAEARALGYRTLTAHLATADRASRALHAKAGFREAAHLPAYYDDGRDAFYMVKRL